MNANWDATAAMIRSWLDWYSTDLKREIPRLRFRVGGRPSEIYPLRANVSLSATGDPHVEDLAVEFGVRRKGGLLVLSAAVVQGDVHFAAFAPESCIEEGSDVTSWLLRSVADGMDFLVSQRQNVVEALRTVLKP